MSSPPTVTVVVPAHNAAWCIERTLASVRSQTFADFEAIIVDDGSSDDTADVAARAVGDDPRFRIVRQPNGKVANARNHGLREARGRLFAPLDADDVWLPTYLERLTQALDQAPDAVFAFARSRWIGPQDEFVDRTVAAFPRHIGYEELLLYNPVGNSSAAVFRTEAVRAIGGYDEGIVRRHGCTEDWRLMLELSWRGAIVPVDEFLVHYRIHPTSASHSLWGATGGMLEALDFARRNGPPLPARTFWRARSLTALGILRRARQTRDYALRWRLLRMIYWENPLWFADPQLRRRLWNQLGRFRRPADPGPPAAGELEPTPPGAYEEPWPFRPNRPVA